MKTNPLLDVSALLAIVALLTGFTGGVAAQNGPGYAFVACDVDTYEITKFSPAGEATWVYSQVRPIDVWPMTNGAVLVAYLPSARTSNRGGVRMVNAAKETVFDYAYNDEIMSCQPMPNGHILVNECGVGRVTEIDVNGKAIRGFDVHAKGKGHQTARLIRMTPAGTVLVAECYSHKAREYDFSGTAIHEWDLPMAYGATRLTNGNTLISGYKPARLVEVDKTGKVVWNVDATDLPSELNVGSFCESTRLPNGHTLVACGSRSSKPGPRVVILELSADKRVVWKQMEPSRTRETTSVKVLPTGE